MDAETLPGCDPTAARERFALLPPGSGRVEEPQGWSHDGLRLAEPVILDILCPDHLERAAVVVGHLQGKGLHILRQQSVEGGTAFVVYPPDPLGTGLMQKGAVAPAHQVLCLKENCPQGLWVQMPADALYQEDQRDGVGALELGRQGRFLLRGETRSGQPCGRAGQQGHELQSVEIPHRVPLSGGIPHGAADGLDGTPLGDAALHIEGAAVAKPPQFDQCLAHRGQGDAVGFGEFSLMGKILFQRIDAGVDLGNKILCDLDIDRIVPI